MESSQDLSNESILVQGGGHGGGDAVAVDSVVVVVASWSQESVLLVSGGGESHGSSFIVDSDESTSRVNIGVAAGHLVTIPSLALSDERLLVFISNLVLEVVFSSEQ